jgi:hypothetical protein
MDDEEDSFPMMAKRKMMKAMKAKRAIDMAEDDSDEDEPSKPLVKIQINVGGQPNMKGKK